VNELDIQKVPVKGYYYHSHDQLRGTSRRDSWRPTTSPTASSPARPYP